APGTCMRRPELDRLYFRVLGNVLGSLAAVALVVWVFIVPRIERQTARNIQETLSAPVAVLAQSLSDEKARGGDPAALLKRAAPRFEVPLALVPRAEVRLEPEEERLLDAGEVVRTGHFLRSVIWADARGTGQVVRMGPINPVHPFGEGRGL